jgi:hypothetical protein
MGSVAIRSVIGTREDFMTRMGQARALGLLRFSGEEWSSLAAVHLEEKHEECGGSVRSSWTLTDRMLKSPRDGMSVR